MTVRRRPLQQVGEPYLIALGDITVAFSLLELHLWLGIWKLVGGSGPVITAGIQASQALSLFRALIHHHVRDPELRRETREIATQVTRVMETRNTMIHSLWSFDVPRLNEPGVIDDARRTRMRRHPERGVEYQFVPTRIEELHQLSADITACIHQLIHLTGKLSPRASGPSVEAKEPTDWQ
jgi:hypothetical protein